MSESSAKPRSHGAGTDALACHPGDHGHYGEHGEHGDRLKARHSTSALEAAVRLFKALGDEARLRTLEMLVEREACVSELAEASGERVSTMSHRLRLLRAEGLVNRRRDGRHIFYSLADHHVLELIQNALDHATEPTVSDEADEVDDDV